MLKLSSEFTGINVLGGIHWTSGRVLEETTTKVLWKGGFVNILQTMVLWKRGFANILQIMVLWKRGIVNILQTMVLWKRGFANILQIMVLWKSQRRHFGKWKHLI